ncbi:MAG: hypothetical protein KUG65_12610 [Sphingomonadaceae bacterium]|nr:hypothetical protein [Sphingomonadaceae bacterium]
MKFSARLLLTGIASVALLAGCDQADEKGVPAEEQDPAMTGALDDQIMVDPQLSGQTGAAVAAGGASVELPPEQRSPEVIAAAKQDAAKNAGGTIESAPQPGTGGSASLVEAAVSAARVGQASRAASTDCAGKAEYSMTWATKLPDALSVYPRGAVQEAAGIDADGCALNVVNFVTPVAAKDVLDYYYTRVRQAGYGAAHKMDGDDHVLGGKNGTRAFVVYVRKLDKELSEVEIITTGK